MVAVFIRVVSWPDTWGRMWKRWNGHYRLESELGTAMERPDLSPSKHATLDGLDYRAPANVYIEQSTGLLIIRT